jgi:predicted nucleotidyltransferase
MGGLEVVDQRYQTLYERALAVLQADERVKAVELSGSIGAGTADQWSDLDLAVIAHADHHDSLLADWPEWLAKITPTVFARTPIAPFIINAVTDTGLTLDLAVYPGEVWKFPPPKYVVGMLAGRPYDDLGEALEYAVLEQLRGLAGPFISLLERDEHLKHLTGVPHLLGLLNTVFLAETGSLPPGKHWNRTFTSEQREAVAALPPVRATRDGVMAFGLALAELLVTRARPLYPRYELQWPSELAAVTATRVQDQLGLDLMAWLY